MSAHGARGDTPGPRAIFPSEPQQSKTRDQSVASCKCFLPPPGWPRMALGKRAAGWEPEGPQCPPDLGWLPAGAAGSVTWQWGDRRKVSHRSQMAASTPRCPKPARDLGSRGGVDGT